VHGPEELTFDFVFALVVFRAPAFIADQVPALSLEKAPAAIATTKRAG
jgi:hypothetical protein